MTTCLLCDRPVKARGYCGRHYCQAYYHGLLPSLKPISRGMALPARLAQHASPLPWTGCLIWDGPGNRKGYGHIGINGKHHMAHRLAFELAHNVQLASTTFVLHRCDMPGCINPDHLFLGSHDDNMQDMKGKGRAPDSRGQRNSAAKLTDEQVRKIRLDSRRPRFIAKDYSISRYTVWEIKTRRRWPHLD